MEKTRPLVVAYPGMLSVGRFQQILLRTEDRDLGAVAPLSGVLEAAVIWYKKFLYSKIFLIFGTLRLFMMTAILFVIANVKQLRN